MFSLIVTITSIALVAALALATLYYGGSAVNKGAADATAAKILLQGQQLLGAAELYKADTGKWPPLGRRAHRGQVPLGHPGGRRPADRGRSHGCRQVLGHALARYARLHAQRSQYRRVPSSQ